MSHVKKASWKEPHLPRTSYKAGYLLTTSVLWEGKNVVSPEPSLASLIAIYYLPL